MMERRRALMAAQETARLPAEYKEVEYIEANSKSYIKTNITIKSSTPRIKLTYYKASQASSEAALFYAQANSNITKIEIGMNATTNRLFAFSSSSAEIISPIVYGHVVDVDLQLASSSPYITITASSGGTTETGTKTTANASNITSGYISLFAGRSGVSYIRARIYKCEVWDNGELTAQFVPCYRKLDNVVGMYEMVHGNFYSSATSNPFLKGGNV
jgi:hypothetical protein